MPGLRHQGDTAHFEYIRQAASANSMSASLATGIPLTSGILTTYTNEQAIVRSRDDEHNKAAKPQPPVSMPMKP